MPIKSSIEKLEQRLMLAATPYTWQNANIGAGGFVDGIFYSPTQPNVIYARTDIGGLYKTTNDGGNWQELFDFVGNSTTTSGNGTQQQEIGVLSFAIDPENPNNLYAAVGEYTGTNGAVFYSTDAGATWNMTALSFYVGGNSDGRATGERIAVDPFNSNIILLGTNANGLWKSTDSGHSFAQVSSFSTTASVNFVYFDQYHAPASGLPTPNIYVGLNSITGVSPQTAGAIQPTNLYSTNNAGTSWAQIAGSTTSPGRNITSFSITSLSRSGTTATGHTAAATGLIGGDLITITGASPSVFDGTFAVASVSGTTFTYSIATGTGSATGTIAGKVNYSEMPNRAALASDGNLYLSYSDGLSPNSNVSQGGVWRLNTATGAWTNISPDVPGISLGSFDQFGYVGLALDPQNPQTVVVTSFDRYAAGDAIWRTTNANAASPTWTPLFDFLGYGGFNPTRNTTTAPWVAAFDDGIGNWAGDVTVNPFNSAQIMYGTGQGIWATNNGTSNATLTAANSWYFPDTGIEFTAVGGLAAANSGTPLFSAMGDIGGFGHTSLTLSPSQGSVGGSGNATDVAGTNPADAVIVGSMGTTNGVYTTNGGLTFTAFAASPGGAPAFSGGSVAESANGATIVWAPNGRAAYYTTNNGTSWTLSTLGASGTLPTGGRIVADKVNPNDFYYWTENSSDNVLTIYISTDGGHTFSASAGGTLGTGNATLAANPYVAGDLWISSYIGMYHSTNFGASFPHVGSFGFAANTNTMAIGAAAPGSSVPSIYIYGTIGSFQGVYRSDDSGNTWVQLNDVSHQWGGLIQTVAADPNVFGRVYLGINGRGVIVGNPASALPAGWSDQDINTPGNPGWATNSTTLSSGSIVNQWTLNGGGAGLASGSDQFNFASETMSGNAVVSAQITGLVSGDGSSAVPVSGVMFRASSNAGDVFAAILQDAAGNLLFESRQTANGAVTTSSLAGVPVGSEYLEIVRNGNNFSGYYSSNGTNWTQLGSTIAIASMPASALAGLAASASLNTQLAAATFQHVSVVPFAITDTSGNNTYAINVSAANPAMLQIFVNAAETGTPTYSTPLAIAPALSFILGSGNDSITVDFTNNNPIPSGGLTVNGGTGNDSLAIVSPSGNNVATINASTLSINGSSISYSNLDSIAINTGTGNDTLTQTSQPSASVVFNGGTGSDILNVNDGTYTFSGDPQQSTSNLTLNEKSAVIFAAGAGGINKLHLAALNIGANALATLQTLGGTGNQSVLVTGTLTIATNGVLDLGGNDMIATTGNLGTIFNALQTGFNAGQEYWNGSTGIVSSAAARDSTFQTTLGERSSDGSTFDTINPTIGSVLVKYTRYGDADLNGMLNGADYQQIDNGFGSQFTGWSNGDFNYDGQINGSDFALIDNAFNQVTAQSAAVIANIAAIPAQPIEAVKRAAFAESSSVPSAPSTPAISSVWSTLEDDRRRSKAARNSIFAG